MLLSKNRTLKNALTGKLSKQVCIEANLSLNKHGVLCECFEHAKLVNHSHFSPETFLCILKRENIVFLGFYKDVYSYVIGNITTLFTRTGCFDTYHTCLW
jgi:hypothetical protein